MTAFSSVVAALQKLGFRATVEQSSDALVIRSGVAGARFSIYAYPVPEQPSAAVESVGFHASFALDESQRAAIRSAVNDFNVRWRFGKASVVHDGEGASLEMDVFLSGDVDGLLQKATGLWENLVGSFMRMLDEARGELGAVPATRTLN